MVKAWRIVTPRWAETAFEGEGARLQGGRWNHEGTAMVYTAGSLALAAFEMLVHLESEHLLDRYLAIPVKIPAAQIARIPPDDLPGDWRLDPVPRSTQTLGSRWAESARSVALEVPSTVVPQENNYLLNPLHPRFGEIEIGEAEPFGFDPRVLKPA